MIKRFCIETATIKERESADNNKQLLGWWCLEWYQGYFIFHGHSWVILAILWINMTDWLIQNMRLYWYPVSPTSDHCTDQPDNFVGTFICYQAVSNDGRSWRYVSLMHCSHRQCLLVLGEFKPVWFYFVNRVRALKWNTMIRLKPPKIEDNNTIKSFRGLKCTLRDNKALERNVFHF